MSEKYIYELHVFNCPKLVYGKAAFEVECACDGQARLQLLLNSYREHQSEEVEYLLREIAVTRIVGQGSP